MENELGVQNCKDGKFLKKFFPQSYCIQCFFLPQMIFQSLFSDKFVPIEHYFYCRKITRTTLFSFLSRCVFSDLYIYYKQARVGVFHKILYESLSRHFLHSILDFYGKCIILKLYDIYAGVSLIL